MTIRRSKAFRWTLLLGVLCIMACAQQGKPLIIDKTSGSRRVEAPVVADAGAHRSQRKGESSSHVVGRGDTLYSIAWRNGTTIEELARVNGLRQPYTIYPGQRLLLKSAGHPAPRRADDQAGKPGRSPMTVSRPLVWAWPVKEKPVREFGKGNKGLDFDLRSGAVVRAAADGEVVYAGAGLGGYESLSIIRHVNGFLSAYSLHGPILHQEGNQVRRGDKVADIPDAGRLTRFHFEIRKDGDPISPRLLLD